MRTETGAGLIEAFADLFGAFELLGLFFSDGAVGLLFAKIVELLIKAFAELLAFGFAFLKMTILIN